jgi:hypothetical protein
LESERSEEASGPPEEADDAGEFLERPVRSGDLRLAELQLHARVIKLITVGLTSSYGMRLSLRPCSISRPDRGR